MYTVKVLSEKEFDKLPYKHTKTSLGLADAKTGVAYVRDTGYNDITKDTIAHELDELMAKISPHEEDGIRYKNLASLGAGAGSGILSSMVPALRPFQGAISAGAGALANKDNRLQGAMQGFTGGGIGTGIGGGVFDAFKGVNQPGGTFGKALKAFVPGATRGVTQYAGTVPGFGGVGTDNPTGALAKFFSSGAGASGSSRDAVVSKALDDMEAKRAGLNTRSATIPTPEGYGGSTITPGVNAGTGVGAGVDSVLKKKATDAFSISDELKKALPGLAIAGAGDLFAPQAQAPDTSGIQARLERLTKEGGEPAAKEAGLTELFRILGEPIGAPPESAFAQGDLYSERRLEQDQEELRNKFKMANENANVANTSQFLKYQGEQLRDAREQRTAARDELSYQHEQEQLGRKFQTMQVALNLDQAQMSQYTQLAQMEIDQLMLQYGIDSQTATNFKQMFSDFGRLQIDNNQEVA